MTISKDGATKTSTEATSSRLGTTTHGTYAVRPAKSIANLVPIIALVVFATLFVRHIWAMDGTAIWAALRALAWWQWGAALAFTALSFRAIGVYDVLVHRVLRTGQSPQSARCAGMKAIAVSQTLGFGVMTGALVRWRCLPNLTAREIAQLSAVVSLSFLAALAVIAALVVPLSGLVPRSGGLIAGGLAAVTALILLARLSHRSGWTPTPVSARTLVALLIATAADTAFAAAALWLLWPDPVSFHLLFAAYLVALGAGLVSNAPGGVGAFDLTFLALLPVTDAAAGMAALLAFRVIYYALPTGVALIGLIRPVPSQTPRSLHHNEAALAYQSAQVFHHPKASLLTLPYWGSSAILGDLPVAMILADLCGSGAPRALYKCSAAQAVDARTAGWQVLRCASDAVLDLGTWSLDGVKKRQLRRGLRTFAASGLRITETRDMASLAPIAATWARHNNGERGLSMGRFCPDYLHRQRVFAAFDGSTPVAFVSFHTNATWTLDLMRHGPMLGSKQLPNGTMQALVYAGLLAAIRDGAATLSLAAVPTPPPHLPFAKQTRADASGLVRFKQAFAPIWQPRYLCAPTLFHLTVAVAALTYGIHRPPPLPDHNRVQQNDEDYSFARTPLPCEALASPLGAFRDVPHPAQRPAQCPV